MFFFLYVTEFSVINENQMGEEEKHDESHEAFISAQDDFIASWGALGTSWGISRTMAQIHALLMVTPDAMSTDEVMAELQISRGNAHTNLKDLVGWGLVRVVVKKGERKEFFEAEKDVWKTFTIVLRERKRREVDPCISLLQDCAQRTKGIDAKEAKGFNDQMKELEEFARFASNMGEQISLLSYGPAMKLAAKIFR